MKKIKIAIITILLILLYTIPTYAIVLPNASKLPNAITVLIFWILLLFLLILLLIKIHYKKNNKTLNFFIILSVILLGIYLIIYVPKYIEYHEEVKKYQEINEKNRQMGIDG